MLARELTIALAASRDWTRTLFLRGDDEDYTMSTRGRMLERLRVILAGRAAEQVRGSGVSLGCWGALRAVYGKDWTFLSV